MTETERSYQYKLYHRRKVNKICVDCGKVPPKPDHTRCESCLAKRRASWHNRKTQGLCVRCSKPTQDGRTECSDCRAIGRARKDKRRKERRQAGLCIICGKNPVEPPYTICLPCRIKKRVREGNYRLDGGSRDEVLARDNRQCRLCGEKSGGQRRNIVVHHIDGSGQMQTVESNHNLNNLITLCKACHNHVHMVAKFCKDLNLFVELVKGLQ